MKRKPRNKMQKKVNLLFPIAIEDFGSENDPCFGKHNDPRATECQNCGDCELCQIVQSQRLNLKRAEIESTKKFKDLEEVDIMKNPQDKVQVRKEIKKFVRKYLRKNQTAELKLLCEQVLLQVKGSSKFYSSKGKLDKLLISIPEKSDHVTYNKKNKTFSWKQ